MAIILGVAIALGCMLGGFVHMGCKLETLLQPSEYIVLLGSAFGSFIVANPLAVMKDTGKALLQALKNDVPKEKQYIALLGVLYSLMREMRSKPSAEVERHIDDPKNSVIFQAHPAILKNTILLNFICDYCRLILMGNARSFEVEALMDEEIETLVRDWQKPYHALQTVADSLPALGIVAAVLGIINALSHINGSPEVLGESIGSALVGTFAGVFCSYGVFGPIAMQVKTVRYKRSRVFVVVKQTLLAYMNGAMPQVALEYGRKTISDLYRPSIAVVEQEAVVNKAPATA